MLPSLISANGSLRVFFIGEGQTKPLKHCDVHYIILNIKCDAVKEVESVSVWEISDKSECNTKSIII